MSFKLFGFLKAKTGGFLKILHSSGCFCMVVQCSRTMLDKLLSAGWYVMTNGTLLFAFFSLYWMRSYIYISLSLKLSISLNIVDNFIHSNTFIHIYKRKKKKHNLTIHVIHVYVNEGESKMENTKKLEI